MCNGVIKLGDFGLAKRKILIENDDSSNENEDGWIESRLIPDEDQYEYEHDNGLLTKTEEHTAGCGTLRYSYLLSNPILFPHNSQSIIVCAATRLRNKRRQEVITRRKSYVGTPRCEARSQLGTDRREVIA